MSCKSNVDCGSLDGGEVPGQGTCNVTSGLCGPCQSNGDCTENGEHNCGKDGSCFNCSLALDGCDNDLGDNPHCDAELGICVDGCTMDAHCLDDCFPKCLIDTYCCVECITSLDCPLPGWKETSLEKTTCAQTAHKCIKGCITDADCPTQSLSACSINTGTCVECVTDDHCPDDRPACNRNSGVCVPCTTDVHCAGLGTPACSATIQKCVSCTNDHHCAPGLQGVCNSGTQACVQCIFDSHCTDDHHCAGGYVCQKGLRESLSPGALAGIIIAAVVIGLMAIAIVYLIYAVHQRASYENQPLMA